MMATVLQKHTKAVVNDDAGILERLQRSPSEVLDVSTNNCDDNLQLSYDRDSEDDAPKKRVKRRIQQFSDSESDREVQQNENGKSGSEKKTNIPEGSESDSDLATFNSLPHKSRILKLSNGSSSDSESSQSYKTAKESTSKEKSTHLQGSETNSKSLVQRSPFQKICEESSSDSDQAVKNEQQQTRMKNKRNKMKDKFKSLMTSRGKDKEGAGAENESNKSASDSEHSNNEANSSIEKIKQKIKERMSFKPSVCDPDTSDEENSRHKSMPKQKQERRTKLTSPKPQRMSAKQAMENMQKIKSESNRMLREKEVSLPYHRPKALSLKDIMSRRKPAVSSDGKSLPIKMNGEQLKQYAQMLDERQKQMMELWQSDTDDENDDKKSDDEEASAKTIDDMKPDDQIESSVADEPKEIEFDASENANEINADISAKNDNLFDVLSQSIIKDTTKISESKVLESDQESEQKSTNIDKVSEEQDSEASMKLVFNDSETSITEEKNPEDNILVDGAIKNIEECTVSEKGAIQSNEANTVDDKNIEHKDSETAKTNTEMDSQLMCLHYDSEKFDGETLQADDELAKDIIDTKLDSNEKPGDDIINIDEEIVAMDVDHGFSDDDMNIEDIDNIIENAEIIRDIEDRVNSQALLRHRPLNLKPTLTGAPGTVIDLNDCDNLPKKSGVELLKERFTFYAKMKTPEELERDRERRIKPGNQHLKLKQKLEDQMAEQRSLEWAKRLDDEKQQQNELKQLRGEDSDDDIDKMEAKLEDGNEENVENEAESESAQEELLENDVEVKDQPRVKNPLVENEAEESDCDEDEGNGDGIEETKQNEDDENEQENGELNDADGDDENDDDESSDSESSESEEEQATAKKGRILKAFEDSDDEVTEMTAKEVCETQSVGSVDLASQPASQDEVLTLAQRYKSGSEDLFTSQGSSLLESKQKSPSVSEMSVNDADLGTQTFSILDSTNNETTMLNSSDKLSVLCGTQAYDDNLDAVAAMCSDSFSQNLPELSITQASQSQSIGEDILALCTGKFYENEFVSQVDDNHQMPLGASQDYDSFDDDSQNGDKGDGTQANAKDGDVPNINKEDLYNKVIDTKTKVIVNTTVIDTEINMNIDSEINKIKKAVDNNLKSILDELHDPEFDTPKPNKFFCGDETQKGTEDLVNKEVESHVRKKLIIDSDDDSNDVSEIKKRKKFKKKKPEKRALQISDDEEESDPEQGIEDSESDIEEETVERLVEYDSEENEIEVKPQKPSKKKHKGTEFFEQEAELTSEDEWVGSGDEDEAGLDRMEREAGDDESFHQGQLQRELGQIHMRDVLDQDKREVRIIQELLFEDGDLGGGGRQRKFKWRNLDGDDETGAGGDELGDTQEEEFESEEQWRKQRHERETFLRQMQNNGEDSLNVSISRTSIIKANLMSKTMSMLLEENQPVVETDSTVLTEQTDSPRVTEKKTSPKKQFSILQDQPAADETDSTALTEQTDSPLVTEKKTSPKKQFSILQQSYQGSILSRGRGALARLAALATPLAADDDAPKGKSAAPSNGRNFVFAALTPEAPKVMKRKAEPNPSTPNLVKKMKTEDIKSTSKSSLLDRMRL